MSIIMLSNVEIERFASWCRQQADSNDGMIAQLEQMGTPGEVIARNMKVETHALRIIARKLDQTEAVTIGSREMP